MRRSTGDGVGIGYAVAATRTLWDRHIAVRLGLPCVLWMFHHARREGT